jgi:hypothetical protein
VLGIATLMIALSAGYFLLKRATDFSRSEEPGEDNGQAA